MELEVDGDEVWGSYFYEKTAVNIPIQGNTVKGIFSFYAGSTFDDNENKEHFQLTSKAGTFTGTWSYKGKTLPVQLKAIKRSDSKNAFAATNTQFAASEISDYNYVRSSLAQFERTDSITMKDGVTLQWFKETHSNIRMFRIIKGKPAATIAFVNDFLENMQLHEFINYGGCGTGEQEVWYDLSVDQLFINADFFSIAASTYYDCGGPHPDGSSYVINLDLNNLKSLSTEELLQFDGFIIRNETNFDEWANYRSAIFGQQLNTFFKNQYPENYEVALEEELNEDGVCNYDSPERWAYSDLLITNEGFVAGAYFPRYAGICDNPGWTIIPFKAFESKLNPAYREQLLRIKPEN